MPTTGMWMSNFEPNFQTHVPKGSSSIQVNGKILKVSPKGPRAGGEGFQDSCSPALPELPRAREAGDFQAQQWVNVERV